MKDSTNTGSAPLSLQTLAIHGAEQPDPQTGASSPNLVMSSTFAVDEPVSFSVSNMTDDTPYLYTRWSNPTIRQLERKLALMEEAESAMAFASGMAATSAVLYALLKPGEHLLMINTNYPGTAEIARNLLPDLGIATSTCDTTDLAEVAQHIRDNTRMIWIETPSNPVLHITDIQGVAKLAREADSLLVVDSTFATPVATKPLKLGASLVVHSLTKYICGHGDALGGAVLGEQELINTLRSRGAMHFGGTISPFNAWLILRGAATLPLRMSVHQDNAISVAGFLEDHPHVELVRYPGLPSHPQHHLARTQMENYSGMIAFRLHNPKAVARKMMTQLSVIHYAVSLGHHRSLIYLMETGDLIESSYMLSGREAEKYRDIAGEGIFRLSVGLEDAQDLIRDLARVLG